MKKVLIITGGNKGIGKGIVDEYLKNDYTIFSLARTKNETEYYKKVNQLTIDLVNLDELSDCLTDILTQVDTESINCITLINNAGTLGKIGKLENLEANDIAKSVNLNTTVPLLLSSIFLNQTANWPCKKSIINISSGAAHKIYSGWSVYGATKAAVDMMTKNVAAEQEVNSNPTKVIAVYPGVVDTEMQTQIRASSKADFASLDRFLELKSSNSLADPKTVGEKIYAIDQSSVVKNGDLVNVNDY
ncbi:MAG: SDR family NAD(P)-dependent oxidoreductase [Pedobacter sp.]|nr:MAG: SDR family NAD(P)-dependent oxidoreductase [Pedobacter sp.]